MEQFARPTNDSNLYTQDISLLLLYQQLLNHVIAIVLPDHVRWYMAFGMEFYFSINQYSICFLVRRLLKLNWMSFSVLPIFLKGVSGS